MSWIHELEIETNRRIQEEIHNALTVSQVDSGSYTQAVTTDNTNLSDLLYFQDRQRMMRREEQRLDFRMPNGILRRAEYLERYIYEIGRILDERRYVRPYSVRVTFDVEAMVYNIRLEYRWGHQRAGQIDYTSFSITDELIDSALNFDLRIKERLEEIGERYFETHRQYEERLVERIESSFARYSISPGVLKGYVGSFKERTPEEKFWDAVKKAKL